MSKPDENEENGTMAEIEIRTSQPSLMIIIIIW
jgi:hypothetical protein